MLDLVKLDGSETGKSAADKINEAISALNNLEEQDVTSDNEQVFTNKTINDASNFIHADATHFKAKANVPITKGLAVCFAGYVPSENSIEVILADKDAGASIGIAEEAIATGSTGSVVFNGVLENIDTSAFSEGDTLYLGDDGQLSLTNPTEGLSQPIAFVLRSDASDGAIFVDIGCCGQDASTVRFSGAVSTYDTIIALTKNVNTVAELSAVDEAIYTSVHAKGYYVANDGGGGLFHYDASQAAVNNGGTVIDGWVRQVLATVTVKEFGAKGDEANDDTVAIQNAMDWAALNSIKLMVTKGNYKVTSQILTSDNLYMEFANGAWIKPYAFSTVGAILTNVVPGDIPASIQDNIIISNPQLDLANLPYAGATSNDNAIGFARQATNVKIIGGYIKNVLPVWSSGIGGTGGKGVNFEHGAYNCAIEGTITFENCYTGLYLNGLVGNTDGYNKGVSTISVDNIIAINCDSAVTVGSIDSTQVTDKDPFWNSYTINSIVFRNCGYSVSRDLSEEAVKLFQKAGAVNIAGARNLTIGSITGWNEDTYAEYSSIVDINNIGYGLTDNIGAVVWGHGHNVNINHITFNGNADSLFHIGMCYAVGDSNPPDNRVLSMDDFYINNAIIYNSILRIIEADEYYGPFSETLNANIKVKMGKDSTDASFCDSYLETQYATLTLDVVNKAGFKIRGGVARLETMVGTTDAYEYDIDDMWLDGTKGYLKSISIADNGFHKIPYYGTCGVIKLSSYGYLATGVAGFRLVSSQIEGLGIGANVEVSTGVPTGTTGTDGKCTIFVDEVTSALYIENRLGGTVRFNVSLN